MSSFAAQIKEANVADIHRVVQCDGEKYLCFTRLAISWFVSVTDGVTLWRVDLDEEEVDALRDLAGVNTIEAYLTRFRYFPCNTKVSDFKYKYDDGGSCDRIHDFIENHFFKYVVLSSTSCWTG